MERPRVRSTGDKILRFLPKATSFAVPMYPPYSPRRDRAHAHRGSSRPTARMVPAEGRRRPARGGFEAPEPTSPRVTCVGRVKHGKNACGSRGSPSPSAGKVGKAWFAIVRVLWGRGRRGGGGGGAAPTAPAREAPLWQLRRFAGGREALGGFEWKARRVADEPEEDYPDEYSEEEEEQGEEEVRVPYSVGGGLASVPRKEVNLWKRRAVAPPRPLQLEPLRDWPSSSTSPSSPS